MTFLKSLGLTTALVLGGYGSAQKAPNLHLTYYNRGIDPRQDRDTTLYDYIGRNKAVVLNFWGTWCKPCIEEISELNKIADEYKDKGVSVIGVMYPEYNQRITITQFLDKKSMHYDILYSDNPRFYQAYNVDVFPTTFILNADSTVRFAIQGKTDYDQLSRLLDASD